MGKWTNRFQQNLYFQIENKIFFKLSFFLPAQRETVDFLRWTCWGKHRGTGGGAPGGDGLLLVRAGSLSTGSVGRCGPPDGRATWRCPPSSGSWSKKQRRWSPSSSKGGPEKLGLWWRTIQMRTPCQAHIWRTLCWRSMCQRGSPNQGWIMRWRACRAGGLRWRMPTPACLRWEESSQSGHTSLCLTDMQGPQWHSTAPETCWITSWHQVQDTKCESP